MKTAQSAKIIMGGGTVNLALVTLTKANGKTKLSTRYLRFLSVKRSVSANRYRQENKGGH